MSDPSFSILACLKEIEDIEQKRRIDRETGEVEPYNDLEKKLIHTNNKIIARLIRELHDEHSIKDTYIFQKTGLSQAKIDELLQKYPKKEEKKNS